MLCEGPTFELPGEAAADKQLPSGATRAPARRGAAHFAGLKVPGTFSVSRYSSVRISLSVSVRCGESAALGASLGVGPEPKVVCRNKSATPPSTPFLLGTASPWSNLAAIPPGLASFLPASKTSQSLPGVQDTAVPAVGADSVRINRPQTARLLPLQRRCGVLLFDGLCLFA